MMATQHSDSGDYTYPSVRFVPAQPVTLPPLTDPERMQAEIDELRKDIKHLKLSVQRLSNGEVHP